MNGAAVVNHGKAESAAKEVLKMIAKSQADPYRMRNKSSICAFYQKGNCKREASCPFLHEMRSVSSVKLLEEKKKATSEQVKRISVKDLELMKDMPISEPPPGSTNGRYYQHADVDMLLRIPIF